MNNTRQFNPVNALARLTVSLYLCVAVSTLSALPSFSLFDCTISGAKNLTRCCCKSDTSREESNSDCNTGCCESNTSEPVQCCNTVPLSQKADEVCGPHQIQSTCCEVHTFDKDSVSYDLRLGSKGKLKVDKKDSPPFYGQHVDFKTISGGHSLSPLRSNQYVKNRPPESPFYIFYCSYLI